MKYISICSGIEAATVAWHGFGWTPLAFSEIEAFPSAVLASRWPQVPNLGDMTKFAEWPEDILAECDLLVGGPPCQAFSVAGLRKSLDDDRGNITLAYVRLLNHIDEVRKRHGRPPAIALYENVPGLLSTKDNAFGCLIGALAGCDEAPETETGKWPKAGYVCGETRRVGYRILDAQFFGVAQRRRRVFLVAVPRELVAGLGDRACPSEILSLRESVRGNPPSRSKAGQGAATGTEGRPRGGGEPCYLDRAMFNQGVNAQYEPQITQDGVAGSMVARGPAAVGIGGQCAGTLDSHYFKGCGSAAFGEREVVATVVPEVANPLTHRMHKGMNTTVDEGQAPIVTTGGVFEEAHAVGFNWQNGGGYGKANDGLGITEEGTGPLQRCNTPAVAFTQNQREEVRILDVASACSAEPGSHQQTYIAQQAVAFSDSAAANSHGIAYMVEGTPPLRGGQGGNVIPAVAYGPRGDAGREGVAKTPSADAEGRVRLRNPSFNPLEELSPTMDASQPHAVAYVKATNPHSKEEAPRYEEAAVSACLNGWDERHDPPKHMVAFAQNQLGEVMGMVNTNQNASGRNTPMVMHEGGSDPAVAFANRTRDGIKVPEIMKDGVVPALTNPGGGGRADAVNVCLPAPAGFPDPAYAISDGAQGKGGVFGSGRDSQDTFVAEPTPRSSMQVRRLTPSECEFLQGFPAGHTDIIFRKKPAADGPRYRALGNSMAVPCMFWLGYRIREATK
jgi:DNA (cytosine-5)-methyltransferase 1